MRYEWDETKREANIARHGIDFAAIEFFEWPAATVFEDRRKDYSEKRMVAYGYIKGRLVAVVYTERKATLRIISLRKANSREVKRYG